jgi:large subunit ribosomal protein L20
MSRVRTGVIRHRRHKKILKLNKGYRGTNSRLYRRAKEASLHAGQYAFIGRKLRKRDMRKLWIMRVNAALTKLESSLNYSRFINALKKASIVLNRKMLSEIAIRDEKAFRSIVDKASKQTS